MKLTRTIALLTVLLVCLTNIRAQKPCTDPSTVITPYYSFAPNFKYAFGFEAGKLNGKSPLGIFAGSTFLVFSDKVVKADSTKSDMLTEFYVKAVYRLTRVDNFVSIFAVASPRYSLEAGFDLHQGLRFVFPFSGRVALGIEPMYAVRQNNFLVNFQLSFCVK